MEHDGTMLRRQPKLKDVICGFSLEQRNAGSNITHPTQAQTRDAIFQFEADRQAESGTFDVFHTVKRESNDATLHWIISQRHP
jgi:hypothetical protein